MGEAPRSAPSRAHPGRAARAGLAAAAALVLILAGTASCEEQAIMQPRIGPDPPLPAPGARGEGAGAPRPNPSGPLDLPEWHKNDKNPENRLGQFAWENVDPKFVSAVALYSTDLRQLVGGRVDANGVARCLRSLADALTTVPSPGSVDVKGAGDKIRIEAGRVASASPAAPGTPSPQKEAIKAALTVASSTLAELGRGPYRSDGVIQGARELDAAIPDITALGALESHQSEIYLAMQKTEPMLRAIQTEAGKRTR